MKAIFKHIEHQPGHSFKTYLKHDIQPESLWHYHPEYELTYILKGSGLRYVGNTVENFIEGDLVLLGPNLPHFWKNTEISSGSCSSVVVQWKDELFGDEIMKLPEMKKIRNLLKLSANGIKFHTGVSEAFRQMHPNWFDSPPFKKFIFFLDWLNSIAEKSEYTVLCDSDFVAGFNHNNSERIHLVHQYLKDHYAQKISLSAIAVHSHMTEQAFSRFFSKNIHKPFFTYLNEYRINIACTLLIETGLQVSEVCYSCGYESLPFFYRQFYKYKNMSPQKYKHRYSMGPLSFTDEKQKV